MNGINQLKHQHPFQVNYGQQMRGNQNVGIQLVSVQNQIRPSQPKQVIQYPVQFQRQLQPQQYVIPQGAIYTPQNQQQQHQLRQVQFPQYTNTQISISQQQQLQNQLYQQHQQYQQQQQRIQQAQQLKNAQYQQIPQQYQNQNRKQSSMSDFQPILPQQLLDYSTISNIQSGQQSPWLQSSKQDNSIILPLDKLTTVTGNTEITARGTIQEIRPFDLNNYNTIYQNGTNIEHQPQIESYQVCHTFQQPDQTNSNNLYANNNNNSYPLNISFSHEKGKNRGDSDIDQSSNKKSHPNSHQTSFGIQQACVLQSAHQVDYSGCYSNETNSIRNSPAVKINHMIPQLSLNQYFNQQPNQFPIHIRSKSVLSPPKSYRDTIKSNEQLYFSPIRAPSSARYQEQYQSVNKREASDIKENIQVLPDTNQAQIVGSVSLLYASKNNPIPHFNEHPSQFHKSPERSKDAVSCVFFNYGEKKKPSRIKIKYTPIEQILTKNELQEYQEKHQDLNLILNNDHTQNLSRQSPLQMNAQEGNILQNNNNIINGFGSFCQNDPNNKEIKNDNYNYKNE